MIARRLKSLARSWLPQPLRHVLGMAYGGLKTRRARRAFEQCPDGMAYLEIEELPELLNENFRPPDVVRYDPDGLRLRAVEKVGQILARVPLGSRQRCLELGIWDGMVGVELVKSGNIACGLDLQRGGFDRRAATAGVSFVQGDASNLPFAKESLDLIYSFAAFEHFLEPARVLAEAWGALCSGGYLYLLFGPVYSSPYGLHAYRQIPVPYCHYLFRENDLKAYAARQGWNSDWPYVNGLTVTEYRRLQLQCEDRFETAYYREHRTGGVGAELIARHPSCFKGKVPSFDDLLVSAIEICFRKRG